MNAQTQTRRMVNALVTEVAYFIEFVGRVLSNPVGVQHSQTTADASSSALLSDRLEFSARLDLVDTLVLWLTIGDTLGDWLLSVTTSDTNTVDNVS